MNRAFILAVLSAGMVTAAAAAKPNVDAERAARYFEEAQAISRQDGGRLWGVPIYGPMILVDPGTHEAVANQADTAGRLARSGKVFVGKLPPDVIVANTAMDWGECTGR